MIHVEQGAQKIVLTLPFLVLVRLFSLRTDHSSRHGYGSEDTSDAVRVTKGKIITRPKSRVGGQFDRLSDASRTFTS